MKRSVRSASTLTLFLAFSLSPLRGLGDDREVRLAEATHGQLPPPVLAHFQWLSSLVARKEQQPAAERAALEKAVSLDPSGPTAERARVRLAELSR
jgi:hypothetical protein